MQARILGSVALMFVAMSLIPLGDSAGKMLTTGHGVSPAFVAFSRFAVGAAMVAVILGGRVHWPLFANWRVWLRAALIAGGISLILSALRTEDIATVFGAFFIGPGVSYILSIWLLGERVRPAQTALLALGFCGVLLVVRPGPAMSPGLIWALLAGVCYGGFLTASKWLADIAPPRQLMMTQTLLGTLMLAPMGLASLPPATWPIAGLALWSGLASATGNLILILAFRREGATTLAPFVYFQLIAATVFGWLFFDTWPDIWTLAGLGLLIGSGFATLAVRR